MDVQYEPVVVDARSLPAEALERIRHQVVAAVESGISQARVAQLFGVSRKSVGNWVRGYQALGESALRTRRRGRRAGQRLVLSADQQAWLVGTVAAGPPDEVGLPCLLWTRRAVGELARRELGVPLSAATVDRYLDRWGLFTGTGPHWRPNDCPVGTLLVAWTHPRHPAGPERLNALVAVSNRGVLLFLAGGQPFTGAALVEFRRRLRVQLGRDVCLLVRAWPAAHSRLLTHWQT